MGGNFKTFGTRLTFFAGKSSPRSETRGCNRKNAPMQALPVGVSSSKKKEFLGLPGGGWEENDPLPVWLCQPGDPPPSGEKKG